MKTNNQKPDLLNSPLMFWGSVIGIPFAFFLFMSLLGYATR